MKHKLNGLRFYWKLAKTTSYNSHSFDRQKINKSLVLVGWTPTCQGWIKLNVNGSTRGSQMMVVGVDCCVTMMGCGLVALSLVQVCVLC